MTTDFEDIIDTARRRTLDFPLISIAEVAKKYGLSLRTLRYREARGEMPARQKHGRKLMYRKDEIAKLFGDYS